MKSRLFALLAILALLLSPAIALAQDVELPCRFYGTVKVDGEAVAKGTTITVIVGDDEHTTLVAETEYGPSSYMIKVVPPEDVAYPDGTSVAFMIGDDAAEETATWERGGNIRQDLTVGEPAEPPVNGVITDVNAVTIPAGEEAYAEYDADTGILTVYIPKGEPGPPGEEGPPGPKGPAAPGGIVLPIIAIVVAVIAIGIAGMSMRRKV